MQKILMKIIKENANVTHIIKLIFEAYKIFFITFFVRIKKWLITIKVFVIIFLYTCMKMANKYYQKKQRKASQSKVLLKPF